MFDRLDDTTAGAWQRVAPATITERRGMKKAAQPENSYTGHIPQRLQEPDEDNDDGPGRRRRHPPILGYKGHLRHQEDRIGTTFTRGLEVAQRPLPAPAGPLTAPVRVDEVNNQLSIVDATAPKPSEPRRAKRVAFADPQEEPQGHGDEGPRPPSSPSSSSEGSGYGGFGPEGSGYGDFQAKPRMAPGSGYGAFEGGSGYGDFQAKPGKNMSARSGYGAFDGGSGYGDFVAKPDKKLSPGSGYGAFDHGSGYGDFQAKPGNMSARSGYGAFDHGSGYGDFQAKPGNKMSARSGYGAFDHGSGYGDFQAKPGNMSARSGYGAFEGGSGYGDFQAAPAQAKAKVISGGGGGMSAHSGYGDFDAGSGYGDFHGRPGSGGSGYGAFANDHGSGYGDFLAPGSGYGAFDGASGYGAFMAPAERPAASSTKEPPKSLPVPMTAAIGGRDRCDRAASDKNKPQTRRPGIVKLDGTLDRQYQLALEAVGGASQVQRLLDAFATTISQRHHKRTELLQALKRNFERREQENHGQMTKAHIKEALLGLSCVFTEDQILALMAVFDPTCRGTVPMDVLLTELAKRAE